MVFHIGETDHMRNRFTLGVFALVLFTLVNALDAHGNDFLRDRLFKLALDPDKGLVLIAQFLVQFR